MALCIVKSGNGYSSRYIEGQIENETDLDSIGGIDQFAPDSKVWLPDYSKVWNLGADGQWYRVI